MALWDVCGINSAHASRVKQMGIETGWYHGTVKSSRIKHSLKLPASVKDLRYVLSLLLLCFASVSHKQNYQLVLAG